MLPHSPCSPPVLGCDAQGDYVPARSTPRTPGGCVPQSGLQNRSGSPPVLPVCHGTRAMVPECAKRLFGP